MSKHLPVGRFDLASDRIAELEQAIAVRNPSLKAYASWRPFSPYRDAPALVLSVKDLIDVDGLPTGYGTADSFARMPSRSAEIVKELEARGCFVIGKSVTSELGIGLAPDAVNPLYPDLSPSGSSTGSATAVAADLCDLSLATDSCGSARFPAANCGVVGLRLSQRRDFAAGVLPVARTLDSLGLMAQSGSRLHHAWEILELGALYGPTRRLSWSEIRVGLVTDADQIRCDPAIASAVLSFARLIASRGAKVENTCVPWWPAWKDAVTILLAESAELVETFSGAPLHAGTRAFLYRAQTVSHSQLLTARRARDAAREEAHRFFMHSGFDFLLLPTQPGLPRRLATQPAPSSTIEQDEALAFTALASIADLPAMSIPAPRHANSAPIGLQVVGGPGTDGLLTSFAAIAQ